jgi:hypothetical protein
MMVMLGRLWGFPSGKSYPVSCVFSWDGGKKHERPWMGSNAGVLPICSQNAIVIERDVEGVYV